MAWLLCLPAYYNKRRLSILVATHVGVPRRVDDDCLQELRWLYDRRDLIEAHRDLAAWLTRWSGKYSKLTG
jgi:transposase-like protein